MSTSPPTSAALTKRVRSDFDNCIGLLNQKNVKQAEIEFKKVMKRHPDYKECILPKALSVFFEICYHKQTNFEENLIKLWDSIKGITNANEDDAMIPMLMLEIFEHLKRPDKAAEIIKIYFDRFGATKEQLKIYFEKVIKICDFDEQAKTALKLYHLDKSDSSNMFQLCVAIFLQATSKPSEKEREMGFEFASKLAEKVCANNPEYLEMYLHEIEAAKFEYVKEPFLSKNGFIPDGFVDAFIEISMDSPLLSPEMRELALKKTSEMFHSKMEALKEGPRGDSLWSEILAFAYSLKTNDANGDASSIIASFIQDLQKQNPLLEKQDLIACIRFLKLVKSEDYGIGTFAERIEEYVERFGHEIDEEQIIYSSFGLLSDAEKDVIIDKSNKILAILKPYIDKRFEIGILTDVIDARSDVVNPEDVKKLGIAAIPSTSHSVSLFYHHRLFLTDIMSTLSSPPTKLSEWEKLIDKWIKIIDILVSNEYPCSIEEHIHGQRIIDRITETCFEYLNSLFTKLDNTMHLEISACFLLKQINQALNPQILYAFSHVLLELGFAEFLEKEAEKISIVLDPSTTFLFENVGHFREAYDVYRNLMARKLLWFRQKDAKLKERYVEGKIEDVIPLYQEINQGMNSIFTARYFSRQQFLTAIFKSDFYDCFFKDSWPAELPFSSGSPDFAASIPEIQTIRILCHFLVIFSDYKKDGIFLQNDLEYYCANILGKNANKNQDFTMALSSSNMFDNPVTQPFMELIKIYVKSIATVLSQTSEFSVENVFENLPPVSKFQKCVDEISTFLYDLFHQKFNIIQRIRALTDAIKMTRYMARLIETSFEAIGKYLNVENIKDFGKIDKYKSIFIRFRQYSIELKLLIEIIKSLAVKFDKHLLNSVQPFNAKSEDEENNMPSATTKLVVSCYANLRNNEYQSSLGALIVHCEFSSLIEIGLLKPEISA